MLAERGKKIDLVLELKVDDAALLARVESRIAAGGPVRADDNPETLKTRLEVYYKNTAPLLGYYGGQGKLTTLDGMAPVGDVTRQIADVLRDLLQPQGVAVVVEGAHLCSMMRGVQKANARMVTSAVLGRFKSDARTRSEFFEHIRKT